MHRLPDSVARLAPEVRQRLDIYVGLLGKWQKTINLVAPSTLPAVWTRHIADALQVQAAVPSARLWADLGSGGGFPGLVTAIALAGIPGAHVHLIESDKRKAAFLQTVSRETGAPVTVHAARIETIVGSLVAHGIEGVSARALAPLARLIDYAEPLLASGATGVFLKGESADAELTALGPSHKFVIESVPSSVDRAGRVLIVRAAGARPHCGEA